MHYFLTVPLDASAVTLSDGFSALSDAFNWVIGNPVLGVLLFVLVGGTLISIVFSLFRR